MAPILAKRTLLRLAAGLVHPYSPVQFPLQGHREPAVSVLPIHRDGRERIDFDPGARFPSCRR